MLNFLAKKYITILLLLYLPVGLFCQDWQELTKKDLPSFYEIQEAAKKFFKDKKKPGWKQFKRWEWLAGTRLDEDGYFRPSLNWQGWLEKQARFGSGKSTFNSNWESAGPYSVADILNPAIIFPYPGMGRINCMAFDPGDKNIIWVGSPSGGLWQSEDGGQNWTVKTDQLPNLGVSDILVHPGNSKIMLIATGDYDARNTLSVGVLKSQDGGTNWEQTGLSCAVSENLTISRMMFHPSRPDTILAATNEGIYKTCDLGDTWLKKTAGDFCDIEVNPANSTTWYAARRRHGVFKSTDSGESWTRLGNGLPGEGIGRIALAVSKSAPRIIYAAIGYDYTGPNKGYGFYGLYFSEDCGNSWVLRSNQPNVFGARIGESVSLWEYSLSQYALVLDVSPGDHNIVYTGSVHISKSTDGGKTWNCITKHSDSPRVHCDHHDFAFLPGDNSTVFSCNDGGIFKSTDRGENWVDISQGLVIMQIYRFGLTPQQPDLVITGSHDNGSNLFYGEGIHLFSGDGNECLIDPVDPSLLYFSYQNGGLVRSEDAGKSFTVISSGGDPFSWVTPLAMDPVDSSILYRANKQVLKTEDRGTSWSAVSRDLSLVPLTLIAIAPSNPDCLYVSNGADIFKTRDGGYEWEKTNNHGHSGIITGIAVHPFNPQILWITFGGYGPWSSHKKYSYDYIYTKVLRSDDGAGSWANISGQLPDIPVNCIVIDPHSLGVYIGTDLGVFYSSGGRGDWQAFDNNLPNVIVTDLEIHRSTGKIWASTYGRGLWQSPPAEKPGPLKVYPPLYFKGRPYADRSLLQTRYINVLKWGSNPQNSGKNISFYRIYRVKGDEQVKIVDLKAAAFEYHHQYSAKRNYEYALVAVDKDNNKSRALYLTVEH